MTAAQPGRPRSTDPVAPLVGARSAKGLAKLDISTVGDLLRHLPRRYQARGELTSLRDLRIGDDVTVLAEVRSSKVHPMSQGRSRLEVVVTDGTGDLALTFFARGSAAWRAAELRPGRRALFAGQVGEFRGRRQLVHPDYHPLGPPGGPGDPRGDLEAERHEAELYADALIPIYPTAGGVTSWTITRCVRLALDAVALNDPLPEPVRAAHGLVELWQAYERVHRPTTADEAERGRHRLRWDEAFVLQVVLAQRRAQARRRPGAARPVRAGGALEAFDAALPFALTPGQRAVGEELERDLASDVPMTRLLQGDVGSGKTVVALRAMLQVVDAGGQAALLAPTEVLAQQHARSLRALLGPLAVPAVLDGVGGGARVTLLTGSMGARDRREALLEAASGQAGIVVGTHALLQEGVQFADLGLVVVDEQHRFGVEQRDVLRGKGESALLGQTPHTLVMTATPIPRSVAMTVYGDLEVSTLRDLPAGRAGTSTFVVATTERPSHLERAWQRVREEVAAGRQAYVVCPRIGEATGSGPDAGRSGSPVPEGMPLDPFRGDDPADLAWADDLLERAAPPGLPPRRPPLALLDVYEELRSGPLAGLRLGLLHGRLPADLKDETMQRFAAGDLDVLLATTVVEVGVDVPNATVMVVLDAERFGVSQLHQLRGRVGRGSAPALCLLVSEMRFGTPGHRRLEAVASTTDGFALSRFDLSERREGDVLGTAQAGRRRSLRLLRLSDEEVIAAARSEADRLVESDPELRAHPLVAAAASELLDEARAGFLEKG